MKLINLLFTSLLSTVVFSSVTSAEESSAEMPLEMYGFYFTRQPDKFSPEVIQIFNNVVNEYIDYYDYSNKTIVYPQPKCPQPICPQPFCPQPICPQPKCPESIIMDTPCDISSTEPESLGFFITLLLLSLLNLGILGFLIKETQKIIKTKLNPFKVRSDPLTA